jgi:hypothetical protein
VGVQPDQDSTADADAKSGSLDPLQQDFGISVVCDIEVGVAHDFGRHILGSSGRSLGGAGQAADQQRGNHQDPGLHLSFLQMGG